MIYEIVYFNKDAEPVDTETEFFAIYQVKDDMSEMRQYCESVDGALTYYNDECWFKYKKLPDGYQKVIDEKEMFTLCL